MNEIYTLTEALFITWCTTEARWSPMWPKYKRVAVSFFTSNRLKILPPTVFLVCAVLGTRRPPTCIVWRKAGEGGEWGEGGGTGAALPSSVVGSIIRSWDSAASTLEHNAMEVNPGISVQEHNYTYMFNFEQVTFSITCFLWLLSVHQSGGFSNFEWWVWRKNEWQQLRQMGGKSSDTERVQNWRKIESFEASWVFSDYKLSTCPQEAMPTLPTQQLHKFKWTHNFKRKWRFK